MTFQYSRTENGFYIKGASSNPPDDLVDITDEVYYGIIDGENSVFTRGSDANGYPILVKREQPPIDIAVVRSIKLAKLAQKLELFFTGFVSQSGLTVAFNQTEVSSLLSKIRDARDLGDDAVTYKHRDGSYVSVNADDLFAVVKYCNSAIKLVLTAYNQHKLNIEDTSLDIVALSEYSIDINWPEIEGYSS